MRATLDVRETHGIFSKSWTVDCRIEFSAAEHAAIDHGRLSSESVYSQGSGENQRWITLGEIVRNGGVTTTFSTLTSARRDQVFIEETLLPTVAGLLSIADRVGAGPKVIEY